MKTLGYSSAITKSYQPSIPIGKIVSSKNAVIFRKNIFPRTKQHPRNIIVFCTKPHIHNDKTTQDDTHSDSNPSFSCPTPAGLVLDHGDIGSWDDNQVGSPVVKRFISDDEERWYMWYHGSSEANPQSDLTGLSVSSNGVHWTRREEPVMKPSTDWWSFDTAGIRPSEVMIMSSDKVRAPSSVYWLYYTGYSSDEIKKYGDFGAGRGFKTLAGLAMSQDGRNWARIEGEHHTGALFDGEEFDSLYVSSPHVVSHARGDLRMYYHSFDPQNGKFSIWMARSRDGIKWVKLGRALEAAGSSGCFDSMGVKNPSVVRDGKAGCYLMAYESVGGDGGSSIGVAMSGDGLKEWRRVSDKPVLMASYDGWDSVGVGSPCLVEMGGDEGEEERWRLYYQGVGVDGRTRIGLGVSHGSGVESFRRWNGFKL